MKRIVVVQIKGLINSPNKVRDTLDMMKLGNTGRCVIIDDRVNYKGMLQKAKDYITWGEINQEMLKYLLTKRGKLDNAAVAAEGNRKTVAEFAKAFLAFEVELQDVGLKVPFRLSPPKKGYKNTKAPFGKNGSLGNRGDDINKLLKRMI